MTRKNCGRPRTKVHVPNTDAGGSLGQLEELAAFPVDPERRLAFHNHRRHRRSRLLFTYFHYTQWAALRCTARTATFKLAKGNIGFWGTRVRWRRGMVERPPKPDRIVVTLDGAWAVRPCLLSRHPRGLLASCFPRDVSQSLVIAASRIDGFLQQQSQLGLEDLAVAILGEALDKLVMPRPLVARDVVEAESIQLMG